MSKNTRKAASAFAVFALAAGAAGFATATPVQAQGPGGGGGRMMFGRGGPGGMESPLQSNPLGLLQRAEVQSELRLSLRQKQEMTDLQNSSRQQMGDRMRQLFQGQENQNGAGGAAPSGQDRRQRFEQMRPQIESAMTAFQGEMNDKIKAILTPEQVARLHQLDLQRRGILSLADPKVADEVKLSAANRTEAAKIAADYQQQTGEVMRDAFQQMRESGQAPDFTSKLSPTRQKMTKIKKASEEQMTALLSPEEKAAWTSAIGEPFTFRADPPQQRQFPGGGGNGRRNGFGGGQTSGAGFPGAGGGMQQ